MVNMKPCIKCGAIERNKRGVCKPCIAKYYAEYRADNRDKIRAFSAKWRAKNTEKIKAINAKWYAANTKKRMAIINKWQKENSEKKKAINIKWAKDNPDKVKAFKARWAKNNPETCRVYYHNRQARKKANGGKLSSNLSELLYARQKGRCACCKEPLGDNYHLDHIMPIKLGGANEDRNIQLLRASCNSSKSGKHPVEYMRSKGFLI